MLLTGRQLCDLTEDRGPWITAEHQTTIVMSNVNENEGCRETASLKSLPVEVNLDLCEDDLELSRGLETVGVAVRELVWVLTVVVLEKCTLSGSLCLLLTTKGLLENLFTGLSG